MLQNVDVIVPASAVLKVVDVTHVGKDDIAWNDEDAVWWLTTCMAAQKQHATKECS